MISVSSSTPVKLCRRAPGLHAARTLDRRGYRDRFRTRQQHFLVAKSRERSHKNGPKAQKAQNSSRAGVDSRRAGPATARERTSWHEVSIFRPLKAAPPYLSMHCTNSHGVVPCLPWNSSSYRCSSSCLRSCSTRPRATSEGNDRPVRRGRRATMLAPRPGPRTAFPE